MHAQNTPNVRFWTYVMGTWVKLTLRPNQILRWWRGGPTDEGWESLTETWQYDAAEGLVRRLWMSDGCDCDGRLSRGGELVCELDKLHAREHDGLTLPYWRQEEDWQRDYQAEAAGY